MKTCEHKNITTTHSCNPCRWPGLPCEVKGVCSTCELTVYYTLPEDLSYRRRTSPEEENLFLEYAVLVGLTIFVVLSVVVVLVVGSI